MYREINIERIKTLEKDILDTVYEIKVIIAIGEETFLKEKRDIYSLRYLLIEAVEAMGNLCNHLLTHTTGQVPKGYPDCFEKLSEAGIISRELGDKLKNIARLRNIIIHKYWEIDDSNVFRSVRDNIGDLEKFLKEVNRFIKIGG